MLLLAPFKFCLLNNKVNFKKINGTSWTYFATVTGLHS